MLHNILHLWTIYYVVLLRLLSNVVIFRLPPAPPAPPPGPPPTPRGDQIDLTYLSGDPNEFELQLQYSDAWDSDIDLDVSFKSLAPEIVADIRFFCKVALSDLPGFANMMLSTRLMSHKLYKQNTLTAAAKRTLMGYLHLSLDGDPNAYLDENLDWNRNE